MLGAVSVVAAALVAPLGFVAADDSAPDDVASSTATTVAGSTPSDSGADNGIPGDIDFQVDMMLGLVPASEMESYFSENEKRAEQATQACMNDAGFEYNPDSRGTGFDDPFADLEPVAYAEQWGFGVFTTMNPDSSPYVDVGGSDDMWPNQEIVDALSDAERDAWYELMSRCQEDAWAELDPSRNPMVQQALDDFFKQVENDPRTAEALDGWRDCMEAAGHPFGGVDAMYEAVYDGAAQDRFFESEAWKPDSPDHAEWQAKVEEEIAIAVANAECSPAVDAAREDVIADLRPDFVEVWQSIDWSLPPVTYDFGDEFIEVDGEVAPPPGSLEDVPDDVGAPPATLDLSEPVATEDSSG